MRLQWIPVGVLAVLCATLASLQYQWTGQIAAAERTTMQQELQQHLEAVSRDFNARISNALSSDLHSPVFRTVEIEEAPEFRRGNDIEVPLPEAEGRWARVTLNLDYIRSPVLPEILKAHSGMDDYDLEIVTATEPAQLIYASFPNATVWGREDASVPILDIRAGGRGGGGRRGPPPGFDGGPPRGRGINRERGGPPPIGPGRWRLLARHKAGSLEALVTSTQRRNLAVSGAVLLLILGTVGMLLNFSRRTQRLAELQMNFVTGVSHELRTPLTVIRTAAFNLRKPELRRSEEKVERYGEMIETETNKLEALVNQVMRFASSTAGHAVRVREAFSVAEVLRVEIAAIAHVTESRGVDVEQHIAEDLPNVTGDREAMMQAIRNLLDNALKYGTDVRRWIGVYAQSVRMGDRRLVEVTIADKGPGIPAEESKHIFEPFFRGRAALRDQVHGTGLGLNLVKSIVEAHGGTVTAASDSAGTRFTIRIPA